MKFTNVHQQSVFQFSILQITFLDSSEFLLSYFLSLLENLHIIPWFRSLFRAAAEISAIVPFKLKAFFAVSL